MQAEDPVTVRGLAYRHLAWRRLALAHAWSSGSPPHTPSRPGEKSCFGAVTLSARGFTCLRAPPNVS